MPGKPQPAYFLKSPRLGFRTWTMADAPLAQALWGNSEVSEYLGGPFTALQIRERLAREIANQLAYKLQYWPIFLFASGEFVGCCGLHPYHLETQAFELGYHLCPQFWGKGLAPEAAQTVISHAFGPLGLREIFAGHHPDNLISKRILEKLGFHHIRDEIYPPTCQMNPLYVLSPDAAR
jgi:RimJ/RimL family protein N-acetyltransferase